MAKGALPVGSELYIETNITDEAGNETVVEKMARLRTSNLQSLPFMAFFKGLDD